MELNFLVHVASLTGLFKHIGCVDEPSSDETIREKVLSFIRDKVRRPVLVMPCNCYPAALFDIKGCNCICRFFLLKLNS